MSYSSVFDVPQTTRSFQPSFEQRTDRYSPQPAIFHRDCAPLVPRHYAYEQNYINPDYARDQLRKLQEDYVFLSDEPSFTEVLTKLPEVYRLLRNAVEPLRRAFGEKNLFQLESLASDDDTVLRVIVTLPSDTTGPAELMRRFKRSWWLKHCARSEASLVFDYEIADGF